jgi:hypothetical protein
MPADEVPMGRFDLPSENFHMDLRLDELALVALEREPAQARYQQAKLNYTPLKRRGAAQPVGNNRWWRRGPTMSRRPWLRDLPR